MPPIQRFLAFGLWLGVTALATALVWAGTSSVAADLTDRPAPLVAHHDVVSALESGTSGSDTAPGITTAEANNPSTAPGGDGAATAAPSSPTAETPAAGETASPGVTAVPAPATPPVTEAPSPPTTVDTRPSATYSTPGGVVSVACNGGFFIQLVSATPNNGYTAKVVSGGPYFVEVHFVRSGRDDPLWAFCAGTPIQAYGGNQIPGLPR